MQWGRVETNWNYIKLVASLRASNSPLYRFNFPKKSPQLSPYYSIALCPAHQRLKKKSTCWRFLQVFYVFVCVLCIHDWFKVFLLKEMKYKSFLKKTIDRFFLGLVFSSIMSLDFASLFNVYFMSFYQVQLCHLYSNHFLFNVFRSCVDCLWRICRTKFFTH